VGVTPQLVLLACCLTLATGCGSDTGSSSESPSPTSPTTKPATSSDDGSRGGNWTAYPSETADLLNQIESDVSPERYARALAKLHKKCDEPDSRIADFAVNVQRIIRDETGEHQSLISLLTEANRSIPKSLGRTRCADIFAAYALLRTGGK
jgi:hypothetical protein